MDTLKIPLHSIVDMGIAVNTAMPVAAIQPAGAEALPLDSFTLEGVLAPVGGEYLFRGRLKGVFTHPCDRCLEEARIPFDTELIWNYVEGPPRSFEDELRDASSEVEEADEAAGRRTYQGSNLDMGPAVWEELQFAAPDKFLCGPECLGLCGQCGANLNDGPCHCEDEAVPDEEQNKGFAGLKDMFPDLPNGN